MANQEQLEILKQGVEVWNKWRKENNTVEIDLSEADFTDSNLSGVNFFVANLSGTNFTRAKLEEADFTGANLSRANLTESYFRKAYLDGVNLRGANLSGTEFVIASLAFADLREARFKAGANFYGSDLLDANLSEVDLREANFSETNLRGTNFFGANLSGANFSRANLEEANLTGANLTGANLSHASLVQTTISNANISKSNVYGVSVWDLIGEFKEQNDLNIALKEETAITIDNIKVAQFVYLILNNKEVRDVINTLTSKTVLIIGRFAIPERKAILDALRNKLREYNLLPIVFDFDRPVDKDFTETIKTLAGISYFVIADVTNPKSSPLELQSTVPDYQIPFVPIIQEGEQPFAMMVDLQKKYNWVLNTRTYDSIETLINALKPGIIDPAVEMRNKLRLIKAQEQPTESLRDYLDKTL